MKHDGQKTQRVSGKKKKAQTQTYTYRRTIKYAEKKKTVNNLQLCFAQA